MKLRILSWNVHGLPYPFSRHRAARLRRIAGQVRLEQPDVVAFQEVWAGSLGLLTGGLADYTPRLVPTRSGNASGGLLLLVRKEGDWVLGEHAPRFRRYSHYAPRHRVWEADGLAGKGAVFLSLRHRNGSSRLWLVNTHLQSRYRSDRYETIRRAQLHELTRWVHELPVAVPVVIAGDFNTPADGDPLYESIAALGVDATAGERRRSGAATNYPVHSTAGWIDYVLARPAAGGEARGSTRLIGNRGVDDPYSDHSGLVVDIVMEGDASRGVHAAA